MIIFLLLVFFFVGFLCNRLGHVVKLQVGSTLLVFTIATILNP